MVELLAPAGNFISLRAVLENGADAVYFGLDDYNMRANAKNFSLDDLGQVSKIANEYGAKTYLCTNIILDGVKDNYTAEGNGGITNVQNGGKLTITEGAYLQYSRTTLNGGAVYAAPGTAIVMNGGYVNWNECESTGNGAGIYLSEGALMKLSGTPSFGGPGVDIGGNIETRNGNYRNVELIAQTNGDRQYTKPRQDIFIAGYGNTDAASLLVNNMLEAGAVDFTECGPGKALQGMIAKIAKGIEGVSITGIS